MAAISVRSGPELAGERALTRRGGAHDGRPGRRLLPLLPDPAREQQEADDVCLLPATSRGLSVERTVHATDLGAGQEAGETGPAIGPDALGGVLLDVAAGDREVHDLPEKGQRMVCAAWGGPAVCVEPAPDPGRGDSVERLRSEGRQ